MRDYWFVGSRFWVAAHETSIRRDGDTPYLDDAGGVAAIEGSDGKMVAAFTDDDLARRFAEGGGEPGWTAALLEGPKVFAQFLEDMKSQGCVGVALDPTFGAKAVHSTPIDEVIRNVRGRVP